MSAVVTPCTSCGCGTVDNQIVEHRIPAGAVRRVQNRGECEECHYATHRRKMTREETLLQIELSLVVSTDIDKVADDLGIKPASVERMLERWRRRDLLRRLTNRAYLHRGDPKRKHTATRG